MPDYAFTFDGNNVLVRPKKEAQKAPCPWSPSLWTKRDFKKRAAWLPAGTCTCCGRMAFMGFGQRHRGEEPGCAFSEFLQETRGI